MVTLLCWIAFALGVPICLHNFYLSFVRYPLYRLRGVSREAYQSYSGIPLFGSLLVALSLIGLYKAPAIALIAIAMICIDTGGIHCFFAVMIWCVIYKFMIDLRK